MNIRADIRLIEIVSAELTETLGDDFDPETFFDTLDGETDVMDVITHILHQRAEAKAFEAASKEIISDYQARAQRMGAKQVAMNKALGVILDATGQAKVTHPLATISRTKPRVGVEITDERDIPSQLCRTTVAPDRAAILSALKDGETIPGAILSTGEPGVTVRVK